MLNLEFNDGMMDEEQLRDLLESGEYALALVHKDQMADLQKLISRSGELYDTVDPTPSQKKRMSYEITADAIDTLLDAWVTVKEKNLGDIEDIRLNPAFADKLMVLIDRLGK
jgi:hypothetical protein